MSNKNNLDPYSVESVVLEPDKPNNIDKTLAKDGKVIKPFTKTCLLLQQSGLHFDLESEQWRSYNPRSGLWEKLSLNSLRFKFSNILNEEQSLSREESQIIPLKYVDDIWYQVTIDNPIGPQWNSAVEKNLHKLPFANGVLDLEERSLLSFHKELCIESKLERNYRYEHHIECPNWLKLLESLSGGDKFVQRVLEAFAFLAMTGKGRLERCILSLYSEMGGSGKGTYMNVLQELAGQNRSASSEISRLKDDTTLGEFEAKTLIVFPEEREMLRGTSNTFARILKLASLDTVTGRAVYSKETFNYIPRAVMVFSSNIHVFPQDGAGSRRILILKTNPQRAEDRDRNFGLKLKSELTSITNRLLEEFDWDMESAAKVIEEAASYPVFLNNSKENADETSTVAAFLSDMTVAVCPINQDRELTIEEYNRNKHSYMSNPIPAINSLNLYRAYKNYLSDTNPGARPLKRTRFYKEVINYYRINLEHELIFTESEIPNLIGKSRRLLGLTPNPVNWIDEYLMFKQ